jgi:hypothetical protein
MPAAIHQKDILNLIPKKPSSLASFCTSATTNFQKKT